MTWRARADPRPVERRAGARPTARMVVAAVLAWTMGACEPEPVAPRTREPPDSAPAPADTLGVLGHGAVTDRYTAEVAVRGQWAYTTTWGRRDGQPGNAIYVWDVAANQPALVDSIVVDDAITLGDVQISDDGSLMVVPTERAEGSILLFDLADPSQPALVQRFQSADTEVTGVHTAKLGRVDGRLYAFLSINPSPSRLIVVDVTDPGAPVQVFSQVMGDPFVHDVFVRDGLLFTALWNGGLTIWDLGGAGTPGASASNPVPLGNVRTEGGRVHNVWWYHAPSGPTRWAFVGEEAPGVIGSFSAGDVHVVDVSDLRAPREVGFFHLRRAGAHNFTLDEARGVLYAAFYNGGVRALDVTGDLAGCQPEARALDGRCDLGLMGRELALGLDDVDPVSIWGVALGDGRLFASDMLSGLFVLEEAP